MRFLRQITQTAVTRVFGDGIGAELAGRGAGYLIEGLREARDRPSVPLTGARLRPGEAYLVVARPRPTRTERRLANKQRSLAAADAELSRPTRSQRRAARRLAKVQRRLDRARPTGRRFRRLAQREAVVGQRFDAAVAPSRRQRQVRSQLLEVSEALDTARASSFDRAQRERERSQRGRRRNRDRFYS
ncbi:MAG: hypothetical protein ACKO5A_09960 [Actinomycetota bacterium]